MRLAALDARAVLVIDGTAVDVERASTGRFGPDPQALFADWAAFRDWAVGVDSSTGVPLDPARLGAPVPRPGQVFAIGVNYVEHAAEAGYPADSMPVTFTKFPSCLTGPVGEIVLPSSTVDWEVELVVAIGKRAERVARETAWDHVAGLTAGQDLSERTSQLEGSKPQFSLAKSYAGFGPIGPVLVTPDEFADPADLALSCSVSGEVMQASRTSRMIYDIPELIVRLSSVLVLQPGDLIFTGTPSGIGNARTPKVFLKPGDVLHTEIEGIGSLEQTFRWAHSAGVA